MQVGISIDGLEELLAAWRQAPEVVREELLSATWEAELLMEREVKERTPVGVTGALRQSIGARRPVAMADNVVGAVGTSLAHAVPVELGTKPHRPPIAPLVDWVRAKLDIQGSEAYGVAKLIQYKIAARGTLAAGMFHGAFAANREQLDKIFEAAHKRVANRLADG